MRFKKTFSRRKREKEFWESSTVSGRLQYTFILRNGNKCERNLAYLTPSGRRPGPGLPPLPSFLACARRAPPPPPTSFGVRKPSSAFFGAGGWETKTPTNHVLDLLAPSWFYLPLPRPIICVLYKAASISSAPLHPRIFFRFISSLLHLITIP